MRLRRSGLRTSTRPATDFPKATALSQTSPRAAAPAVTTEVVIIGAGPCGLFQVFELGLLGISAHVVDSLAHPGGQCAELYPDKPIYDIPALPVCGAQELVDRLLQQIKPFKPQFHLGAGSRGIRAVARMAAFACAPPATSPSMPARVVIAAGVGSFQPRRIGIEGVRGVRGHGSPVPRQERRRTGTVSASSIFGGGDSALDWTLELLPQRRQR